MTSATSKNRITAGLVLTGFLLGAAGCNDQVACRSVDFEATQAATSDANHFSVNLAAYNEDQTADSSLGSDELTPTEVQSESEKESQTKAEVEPQAFEETHNTDNEATVQEEAEAASQVSIGAGRLLPKDRPDWLAAEDDFTSEIHTLVITTTPERNLQSCEQKLATAALSRFTEYASSQLSIDVTAIPQINEKWVEDRLLTEKDRFFLEREIDGSMSCSGWAKLQIDAFTRQELRELNQQSQWLPKSVKVGAGLLGFLTVFGLAHGALLTFSETARKGETN